MANNLIADLEALLEGFRDDILTEAELNAALTALGDVTLGTVLRAKGIVPCADGGEWLHFDYVPGAPEIRRGAADYTGRLCVIGSELDEERIAALFGVNEK